MKKVDNVLLNSKTGGFAFAAMMTVYLFVNFIGQAVLMIAFPQGGVSARTYLLCPQQTIRQQLLPWVKKG
jgi:hypothetical protein